MSSNNQQIENSQEPVACGDDCTQAELPKEPTAESSAKIHGPELPKPQRGKALFRLLQIAIVVLAIVAGGIGLAFHQAQQIPDFYSAVLEIDYEQAKADGLQFERNLIRAQNVSRRLRPWKIEFTQDQVNGWLCADLPEKFPDAIPSSIADPRVCFEEDTVKIGFQYDYRGANGYVVLNAEVFGTETQNEIAIRIASAKAGFIPLPIGPWLEKVVNSIRNAGIPVHWSNSGGTPVAIFTLPENIISKDHRVIVQAIQVQSQKLTVTGKTISNKQKTPKPKQPKSNSMRQPGPQKSNNATK